MKLNIIPFREFWLDCYSTAIYSILLSKTNIDKIFIYQNNYIYKESRIDFPDKSVVWSIMPQSDMKVMTERILENIKYVDFKEKDNPIFILKSLLRREQIIFLGVDIYYWISDNFNWHRNHFNHYSLLNGFNDEKKSFYVLETGNVGYKEYEISEEELLLALKSFSGETSMIAKLNYNAGQCDYDKKEFIINAKNIISSIDEIINKKNMLLVSDNVTKEKHHIILDHVQTHLYGMESRQRANCLLISNLCKINQKHIYIDRFNQLQRNYATLKNLVLSHNIKESYIELSDIRNEIIQCLLREKEIWLDIIREE